MTNFTGTSKPSSIEFDDSHKYPLVDFDDDRPKMKLRYKIAAVVTIFAVVLSMFLLGAMLYHTSGNPLAKDSGITACEDMAANVKAGKKSSSSAKMTELQRDQKLLPFQNSQYPDIKVAGGNLVETIYKADHMQTDDGIASSIVLLTTIQTQYAALQTACANHGVNLPPLPAS